MRIEGIRTLEGPNVFHNRPVIVMSLRLLDLADTASTDISGFTDRLVSVLPGLHTHHCSRGREGGFVERLREGTYFGHIVEHIALELAGSVGSSVTYGKTRYAGEPGFYDVIVRFDNEAGMRFLLRTAVELAQALVRNEAYQLEDRLEQARQIISETALGPSTSAIVRAAARRGIPWRRLNDASLIEFGYGRHRKLVQAALSGTTSHLGVEAAGDKELAKQLLQAAFLPVPEGRVVSSAQEAAELLSSLGGPLVIKPLDGNQGRGVTLDLTTEEQIEAAFVKAAEISEQVIVEKQLSGQDYRVLVVGGRMVAASLRIPCRVTGDGVHTIAELIDAANSDPRRGTGHEKPLTRIVPDTDNRDLDLTRVPLPGETVPLQQAANLSLGGTARDVTDEVHPEIRLACERAARAVGLDICGVDLVTRDISRPLTGGIVEVNAAPGLRMHLHPDIGTPRDVGSAIIDMLYPPGTPARIPVLSVTGTNGKTTVTRLIAHILTQTGLTVGMTSTDGVHIGPDRVASGDMTGPASAKVVLSDPTVDAAVLECARGGLLRRGLGYDWSDVAVITNIRHDHIGQDGIEDLEDLVWIKSLVAERVREGGTLVLNADDAESAALAEHPRVSRLHRRTVFYSTDETNPRVLSHRSSGGTAYLTRNGWLIESNGAREQRVIRIADIPISFDGTARFQVSNCLAAVAACRAQGCSIRQITAALRSFSSAAHNPGRANIWQLGQGYCLIDYGHNPDAFRAAAAMAAAWNRPVIGIAGVPGDRSDDVVKEAAAALADGFSKLWIKEDRDLRGRVSGEVAELLMREVRAANPAVSCKVVLDELAAITEVLEEVRCGATAILFYERLEPVQALLQKAGAQPVEAPDRPGQLTAASRRSAARPGRTGPAAGD